MTEAEGKALVANKIRDVFRHDDEMRALVEGITMEAWRIGARFEREACARIADGWSNSMDDREAGAAANIATAIRKRQLARAA